MDLSDGLADAVTPARAGQRHRGRHRRRRPCRSPRPPAAGSSPQGHDPVRAALAGGDDYELLFSVSARVRGRLRTVIRQARGVPVTRIGELTASPAILAEERCRDRADARRVHPLLSAASERMVRFPKIRAWLEQLLHTHDTPQRTAARLCPGGVLRLLPVARPPHRPRPDLRLRAEPEPGRRPARGLLQPALDPGALLHASRRGSARPSCGPSCRPASSSASATALENRSWTEFRSCRGRAEAGALGLHAGVARSARCCSRSSPTASRSR